MAELVLYNYFRSSTSYRVRIALHYKNLSFEYKPVHLLNDGGEQYKSTYANLNPMSEVPTLIHDGLTIAQSMAIIEYLDEMFPHPALFPKEPHQKARIRQFCENINSFMHPLGNLKVLQHLEKKHGYTAQDKEQWVQHWLQKGFLALENMVKKNHGTYCFGNEVTAADLFLVPQIFAAKRFNVDLEPYTKLNKINENALALECFQMAHPMRQVDTPEAEKLISK